MADNMELNISNVLDVLEEYSDFNFSRKINTEYLKEHLYRLALGVNTLGDSITNVLIDNKKAGITLETIEKQKDNLHNFACKFKKYAQTHKRLNRVFFFNSTRNCFQTKNCSLNILKTIL